MKSAMYFVMLILCITFLFTEVQAEEYMDMSLDDLLNLKIESVSKKEESTFDAPLSSTVITRQEIMSSGATSIQEALRLVPGMIVREQSSGNFDIHIRGFDNVPPNMLFPASANSITLVMIDNRPVYNYFQGATFWETLPVSLTDVEKIEIIRGPSAAMYGPNAVAGVINIITRRPDKEGPAFTSDIQGGEKNRLLTNGSVEYKYKDKFGMILSADHQQADRQDTEYYDTRRNIYVSHPRNGILSSSGIPLTNPDERYPDPDSAVDKKGANSFILFTPSEQLSFDVSLGFENSRVQKVYADINATPFTTGDSNTQYADAKVKGYGFTGQISYLTGKQEVLGINSWKYDVDTLDFLSEYDLNWKNLNVRPGFGYRKAEYNGSIIGGKQEIVNSAFSLRADYMPCEKWRFIAAGRLDHYNHPEDEYFSYQLAGTYKLNDNRLLRAAYSRSHRSPAMLDTYTHLRLYKQGISDLEYSGNENLELLTMDTLELGYRSRIFEHFMLDAEIFYQRSEDYAFVATHSNTSPSGISKLYMRSRYENFDVTAQQYGMTVGISYVRSEKFYAKLFGTIQYTHLYDHAPNAGQEMYGSYTTEDSRHEATPLFYGGFHVNWKPLQKLNLNTSAYYYTKQTFLHDSAYFANPVLDVDQKLLWNSKISYNVCKHASVYLNIRNLLNDNSQEFAWTDDIGRTVLVGVHAEF